jgi:hypothetical protein
MFGIAIDVVMSLLLAGTGFYVSYLGVRVTLNPIQSDDSKAKRVMQIKFIVCGAVIAILTIAQGIRNGISQHKLGEDLSRMDSHVVEVGKNPPRVDVHVPPAQVTVQTTADPALVSLLKQGKNKNVDTLKFRTLLQADKLEAFANGRKPDAPVYTDTQNVAQEEKLRRGIQRSMFDGDTLRTYHSEYETDTVGIINELKGRGLDSTIEAHAYPENSRTDATNPQKIADELRTLANKLDLNGKVIH